MKHISAGEPRLVEGESDLTTAMSSLRELVRSVPYGRSENARLEVARRFCHAAIAAYWAQMTGGGVPLAASHRHPVAGSRLSPETLRQARSLAATAAQLTKPAAAYLLSTAYTMLLPDPMRSKMGVFFTPPPIADRLLDLVEEAGVDWLTCRVVDPAAGGGAFVTPVAVRMAHRLAERGDKSRAILRSIERRVRGLELDAFSGWMAWVFLEVALWDHCVAAGRRLRNPVRTRDALTAPDSWYASADLVIANPPYGKFTPAPEIRAHYRRSLYGHANLYGVFTDLAVRLARRGGIVGLVTPTSFLGGQYFTNLRGLLGNEAPPLAVDFIADRSGVFEAVLQETVLGVFGRGREPGAIEVHHNQCATLDSPCKVTRVGAFTMPADPRQPWLLPRQLPDVNVVRAALTMTHRLRDYGFRVSTGPLVWNRHRAQLLETQTAQTYPLIWAEAILPGGEFRFGPTRRNHVPYCTVAPSQQHLLVRDPCVLVQRTTAKEQDRRLIAAALPPAFLDEHGGVVIENHVNVIRNGSPAAGGCEGVLTGGVGLAVIARLLNSLPVDHVFRCISGSVAVSAYELEALPVPAPDVMLSLVDLVLHASPLARLDEFIGAAYRIGS